MIFRFLLTAKNQDMKIALMFVEKYCDYMEVNYPSSKANGLPAQ